MSVLRRQELEDSPLADLHAIASELGLEGYRALRRDDLVAAILQAQGGEPGGDAGDEPAGGQGAASAEPRPEEVAGEVAAVAAPAPEPEAAEDAPAAEEDDGAAAPLPEQEVDEDGGGERELAGVLDVLPNGSGFVRVEAFAHSRDDVYVSPAQIRRCELRAGDEVGGPVREPRRNERHPSLVRVERVNGGPAEPPEERPRFSELTPLFPAERVAAPAELETTPIGKGSRVAIGGPPGAGATTLLRRVASTLAERAPEVQLTVLLVGVRPEEVTDWRREVGVAVAGGGFDRSVEAQVQVAELVAERAKRVVERGRHAAIVVDSLEAMPPGAARRLFGAARNTEEGGSLTVVASTGMAWEPQRQATTRVMLEPPGEAAGGPRLSSARSSTLRAELLGAA